MRRIITFLTLIISLNLFSEETISIKGKLFFSHDFYYTFSNLLVKIDNSDKLVKIKEDGIFEIKTSTKQENYKLIFSYRNIIFKEFDYKFEWTKRKRPKSISLADKCEVSYSFVKKDYKEKKLKLYVFNKNEELKLTKKDLRIQKRANVKYIRVPLGELINYDCFLDYNQRAFKYFLFTKNKKYLDKLRKDVIGYNYRYNR